MLATIISQMNELFERGNLSAGLSSACFAIKVLFQANNTQLTAQKTTDLIALWKAFAKFKHKLHPELQREYLNYFLPTYERYFTETKVGLLDAITEIQSELARVHKHANSADTIALVSPVPDALPPSSDYAETMEALKLLIQSLRRAEKNNRPDLVERLTQEINELLTNYYLKICEFTLPAETATLLEEINAAQKGLKVFQEDLSKIFIACERRLSLGLYNHAWQILSYRPDPNHRIGDFNINALLEKAINLNQKILAGPAKPQAVSQWQEYRKKLSLLRQKITEMAAAKVEITAIQHQHTIETQDLMEMKFKRAEEILGYPVCDYFYAWTGSYALEAASLSSDAEGWFVISKKSHASLKYWQLFLNVLWLEMEAVGESIAESKGLHGDSVPRVDNFEKMSTTLLDTPEDYVSKLTNDLLNEDVQRAFPKRLAGDEKLYNLLIEKLQSIRANTAMWHDMLRRTNEDFAKLPWQKNKNVAEVDFKTDCMQPLVVALARLRYYLQLPDSVGRHPLHIIKGLVEHGHLDPAYAADCSHTLSQWYKQRLDIQIAAYKQGKVASDLVPYTPALRQSIEDVVEPMCALVAFATKTNQPSRIVGIDPRNFPAEDGTRLRAKRYQQSLRERFSAFAPVNNDKSKLRIAIQFSDKMQGFLPDDAVRTLQSAGWLDTTGKCQVNKNTAAVALHIGSEDYLFSPVTNALFAYAGLLLAQSCASSVIPPFYLVRLSVNDDGFPVIVYSQTKGRMLSDKVDDDLLRTQKQNPRLISELVLLTLLLEPVTQNLNQFVFFTEFVGEQAFLQLHYFGNNWGLSPAVVQHNDQVILTQQPILLMCDVIRERFSPAIAQELLALDPLLLFQKWSNQLNEFQTNTGKLFPEQELKQYFTSSSVSARYDQPTLQSAIPSSASPYCLPAELIENLFSRFMRVQQVLSMRSQLSCLELIQCVEPLLGHLSQVMLPAAKTQRERAQLLPKILTTGSECLELTHRVYLSMHQSGMTQIIPHMNVLYSQLMTINQLQEILERYIAFIQSANMVLGALTHSQSSLYDFNELTAMQKQHVMTCFDWQTLKQNPEEFVAAVGKVSLMFLVIRNCSLLTNKLLGKALVQSSALSDLVLESDRQIEGKGLFKLCAKKTKRLKNMTLRNLDPITQLGDETTLAFLERLNLDTLPHLEKLALNAPRLQYLSLHNTPNLNNVDCQFPNLRYLHISGCNLTAERLKAMIISMQATQLQEVRVDGANYDTKQVLEDAKKMLAKSKSKKGFQSVDIAKQFYESSMEKFEQRLYLEAIRDLQEALRFHENYSEVYHALSKTYHVLGQLQEALWASNRACDISARKNAEMLKQKGIVLFELKRYQEAICDFSAAMQSPPPAALLFYYRAKCRFAQNSFEDALNDINTAIDKDPNNADAYYLHALVLVQLKKFDVAMPNFNCAIQIKNDNPQYYRDRANLYLLLKQLKLAKDLKTAKDDIDTSLRLNPEDAVAHNIKGEILIESGNNQGALTCFLKAKECNSQSILSLVNVAKALNLLHRHQEAIKYCDQALAIDGGNGRAYEERGMANVALHRFEPASADFTRAIRVMPGKAMLYRQRSNVRMELGQHDESLKDTQQANRLDPAAHQGNNNTQSSSNLLNNKFCAQLKQLDERILRNPRDANALNERALVKYHLGDYKGAIADCDIALQINPKLENAYSNRGLAFSALGNQSDAIKNFDHVLGINPNHELALNNRGCAKLRNLDFKGAILDFDRVILIKSDPLYYSNRAEAKMSLCQFEEAIIDFNEAARLDPNNFKVYELRGTCHMRCSRLEEAKADLKHSLQINPENHSARANLALISFMVGDYRVAVDRYDELLRDPHSSSNAERALWLFYRGACKGNLALFSQAIDDYSNAIKMDNALFPPYGNRSWVKYSLNRNIEAASEDRTFLYQQKQKANPSLIPFIMFSYLHLMLLKQQYDAVQQLIEQLSQLELKDQVTQEFKNCGEIAKQMMDWLLQRSPILITPRFNAIYQLPSSNKKIKALYCGDIMARFLFDVIVNPKYKVPHDRLVGAFVEVVKVLQQAMKDYPGEIKLFYYQAELFALIGQKELGHQLLRTLTLVDGEQMFINVMMNMPSIDADLKSKLVAALPQAGITPMTEITRTPGADEITVSNELVKQSVAPLPAVSTSPSSPHLFARKPLPAPPKGALTKSPSVTAATPTNPANVQQGFFAPAASKAAATSLPRAPSPVVAAAAAAASSSPAASPTSERRKGFLGLSRGSSGSSDGKKEKKTKKEVSSSKSAKDDKLSSNNPSIR